MGYYVVLDRKVVLEVEYLALDPLVILGLPNRVLGTLLVLPNYVVPTIQVVGQIQQRQIPSPKKWRLPPG